MSTTIFYRRKRKKYQWNTIKESYGKESDNRAHWHNTMVFRKENYA